MVRYALGTDSYAVYGDEASAYTEAASITKQFGLINDEVPFPNSNPNEPIAAAGAGRGPHVWSPMNREFPFEIPFHVQNADAPFHVALGQKVVTVVPESGVGVGDGYTKTVFTETVILPTITVEHGQRTLGLRQRFIGTKASLGLTCQKGESLKATLNCMAALQSAATGVVAFPNQPVVPTTGPFRFTHIDYVKFYNPGTQVLAKEVETLDSLDFNWNNGLASVPHGGTGRQTYSVVEEESANLYDMKIGVTAVDTFFFDKAFSDGAVLDLEVAFTRQTAGPGTITDGAFLRLKRCKFLDGPIKMPSTGRIMFEVPLGPNDTEIEIRTPTP